MNTESVNLRRVTVPRHADDPPLQPGDFAWDFDSPQLGDRSSPTHFLYLCLPGCGGGFDPIEVQKGAPGGPRVWGWDGNEEKPTLTPSIHDIGRWHGWLRAGRLESC